MDNDTSWCPVCDRQIQPKRYQVPVVSATTTTTPVPAPPPSSPVRRTKQRGGGFVQGTGRVKHNGALKRTESKTQPPPQPPVRMRTVIDQGPTPLYCSDACQLADLNRGLPHDFDPTRQRTPAAPVPFVSRDSDSSASSSGSQSSVDSASSRASYPSPSLATLAAIYHFTPPPFTPPVDESETAPPPPAEDLSFGIMMSARRIANELCAPVPKRNAMGDLVPRKPIPGWTDGTNAWRSSIYSMTSSASTFSAPSNKSFATRSTRGLSSTATASYPRSQTTTSSSLPAQTVSQSDADLLTKFSESFRRPSTRATPSCSPAPSSPPSSSSFPPTSSSPRRRSVVQRGAEGKLLVPPVLLQSTRSASTTSVSTQSSAAIRPSVRSPLSQASSSEDEDDNATRCDSATSLPHTQKRPIAETRSWSYDNIKTYPIMRLPPKKKLEKRLEKQLVDGVEVDVEVTVEVEVEEKLKRLFLFNSASALRV